MTITQPVARPVVGGVARAASGPQGVGPTRGPELITTPIGTGWTASAGTVTVSSGKVTFSNAAANDSVSLPIVTEDGALYEFIYTMVNRTAGNSRGIVAGATTAHQGVTSSHSADGTFTQQITTSGAGANALKALIQANAAGSSFEITFVSLKKVLR